jgi:hypothetical protein
MADPGAEHPDRTGVCERFFQGRDRKFHGSAKKRLQPRGSAHRGALPANGDAASKRRSTGSQDNSSGHLDPPKSGQIIIAVPGFQTVPRKSEQDEKKLLTGSFERTISRLRRRRRAHRFKAKRSTPTSNKILVRNLVKQGVGKFRSFSLSVRNEGTCGRRSTVRGFRLRIPWLKPKLICLNTTKHTGFLPVR